MFYNPKRKLVRNGMLSPVEFERQQKTKTSVPIPITKGMSKILGTPVTWPDAPTIQEGTVEGRVGGTVVGERGMEGTAARTQSCTSLEVVVAVAGAGGGAEGKGNLNNQETDASAETKGAAGGMVEGRPKASMRKRGSLVAAHISHQQVTRNLAGDVQGATLARERVAAEGDGVEMMLGVLWLNYKPEYFFFDM